ncbi:MAG: CDC27 family protein [Campylobacterales bacterium]|nr:CDC27 family protein [Campylobacterales bacterium]
MYEIKQLEERWQRYKIKQYAPAGVLSALFIFIAILGIFLSSDNARAHTATTSNLKDQNIELKTNTLITKIETQNNNDSFESTQNISNNHVEDALFLDPKDAAFPVDPVNASATITNKPKVAIEIKKVSVDKGVLDGIMERFKKEKDPYDSLFLASTYYSDGEYSKAHDWAVETNKIANIDESWMILAKAKYKLGKKEEAIELLRAFLKTQDSKEVATLLDRIKKDII